MGLERLYRTYRSAGPGKTFQLLLNQMFDGIVGDIETLFNGWTPHFQADTYFTCLSEHANAEDSFGRLSMWRAYGEGAGIALVLNSSVLLNPADGLAAYSSPVAYLDDRGFEAQFGRVAENLKTHADFLKSRGRDELIGRVFNMLRFAALCTKHPGFAEEREWRVVYCPTLEKSSYLVKDIQIIKGVPQPIYKIPLKDIAEVGFFGAIPTLLNRIIIGPTEYSRALFEAFVQLLEEAGVESAAGKVCVSDIPLRR